MLLHCLPELLFGLKRTALKAILTALGKARLDGPGFILFYLFIYLFSSFEFLGLHLQHMEVPRLGVESEL